MIADAIVSDVLVVLLPTLGALVGAYLGVEWTARSQADRELRALTDAAAAVLARADQERGNAYVMFVQEGPNTSDRGFEAVMAFRRELSEADQIRYRIAACTKSGDPVFDTYAKAVDALAEVSRALGTAASSPARRRWRGGVGDLLAGLDAKMTSGETAFRQARDEFLDAARTRFG